MASPTELIEYAQHATKAMLDIEGVDHDGNAFRGGLTDQHPFRPTQKEAVESYDRFLRSKRAIKERLEAYLEIPTGVGKTGVFVVFTEKSYEGALISDGVLDQKMRVSGIDPGEFEKSARLRTMIVVPTINLLKQTYESFEEYAPELAAHIGQYGGVHKQLHKPVTIITYSSWKSLTESGTINGDEVDILIFDEAHRGLSERSQEALIHKFDGHTLKIAFTATARYDEDKTLERTHTNQILSIPLSRSIKRGELANYIQTQFYVVRVSPSETLSSIEDYELEDYDAPELQNIRRVKQEAWNQRAVKFFRDGRDHHTGDLLSDNQAGFFVQDTYQANRVAKLLNDDVDLVMRAKNLGYRGVAVAIHSKMSVKRQEKLMDQYQAGEWMAVVGDEKFKEGFDHQPLKTIIDCPHGSLVDKAQILGRGARKWYNEKKQRYEGLTFCDTIVYIGSDDPDRDAYLRERALRNATIASDILEDNIVFSPSFRISPPSFGGRYDPVFEDDPNVEEYTKLEDVKTFLAERKELVSQIVDRSDYIRITGKMLEQLILNASAQQCGLKHY